MDDSVLRHLLDSTFEGIAVIGEDYKVVYCNATWVRITRQEGRPIIGKDFSDFHTPAVSSRIRDRFTQVMNGKMTVVRMPFEVTSPEERARTIEVTMERVLLPGGMRVAVTRMIDVTEWENERKALEETTIKYETLVATMNDGFAIDDSDGRIVYANDAFCGMLGRERAELIGAQWVKFAYNMQGEDVKKKMTERRTGASEKYEIEWAKPDGSLVPTITSATPYFGLNKEFLGTFAVITEISDQKDAEDTIQFYLDLLTHDVANQLQVIMTSTGLLDEQLPKTYVEEAKQNILDAVERCNRLITKMKRAGQMKSLAVQEMDLTSVILERIRVLEKVYSAEIHEAGLHEPIAVEADILLGELFWNLLENSARHNPKDSKQVWVKVRTGGSHVTVEVADNGPGLSDARKATLFDKSRRTAGVGLTLVYQMAKKYGGRIEVTDRVRGDPTKGTKFIVTLRLARPHGKSG